MCLFKLQDAEPGEPRAFGHQWICARPAGRAEQAPQRRFPASRQQECGDQEDSGKVYLAHQPHFGAGLGHSLHLAAYCSLRYFCGVRYQGY